MNWWQLLLLELVVVFVGTLIYCSTSYDIDKHAYQYVNSEITVSAAFDKLEERRDAVETCRRIIEDNGYVMHEMDDVCLGGKHYVTVTARKYGIGTLE